jgi:hypothetical protein
MSSASGAHPVPSGALDETVHPGPRRSRRTPSPRPSWAAP